MFKIIGTKKELKYKLQRLKNHFQTIGIKMEKI